MGFNLGRGGVHFLSRWGSFFDVGFKLCKPLGKIKNMFEYSRLAVDDQGEGVVE